MNDFDVLLEEITRGRDIYYHLTPDDYGPVVEFYPRKPRSACTGEPEDARICVSPSLAGCVVAGSFSLTSNAVLHVYATRAKAEPVDIKDVFDADVTEEHWIMDPAVFVKVGELDLDADVSNETKDAMKYVAMPYERYDEEDEEYDGEPTLYMRHMAAKDEAEQDLSGIESKFHKEARRKLQAIIPRIKDVPGQGLFYFAKDEYSDEQVEEAEVDGKKIPQVKAPGNFHQAIPCKREEKDEEDQV